MTNVSEITKCLADTNGSLHPLDELQIDEVITTIVHQDNLGDFQALLNDFKEAENYIKISEISVGELDIPSINELRYFGYHLTKALSDSSISVEKQREEIYKAKRHCNRASYDAIELGLLNCFEIIADFHCDYGSKIFIQEVIPNYIDKMTRVEEIKNIIAQGERIERGDYYKNCEQYLIELNEIKQLLLTSQYLLDAKRLEREDYIKKAERAELRANIATVVAILTLILSIIFSWRTPSPIGNDKKDVHIIDGNIEQSIIKKVKNSETKQKDKVQVPVQSEQGHK